MQNLNFADDELFFDDQNLSEGLTSSPNPQPSPSRSSNIRILLFNRQQSNQPNNILWPVYGWRVAAPKVKSRQLDFLQLTSLRLIRAGITHYHEQSKLLGQNKDFLYNVISQLYNEGYINDRNHLTEKGEKILQQDGEDEEEITDYGWIFQEAVAGEVLSFFHTDKLPFTDSNQQDTTQTFSLPWIYKAASPPSSVNIIAAIKTQKRLLKIAETDLDNEEDYASIHVCDFTNSSNQNAQVINNPWAKETEDKFSIRLLSKQPQKFYLLVSSILNGTYDGDFSLGCPFGLPDGFRWVRLLNFAKLQSKEGKKIVDDLQFLSREKWKKQQPPELEPINLERQVDDNLISKIGSLPSPIWTQVWEELERMEQSKLLLERGFNEVDTTITRAQRVLEQLILTLLKIDPIPPTIWELYKRKDALAQCLQDTVTACGGNDIPEQIISTKLGAIRHVLVEGKNSLRPYIATFLLSASRRSSLHRHILQYIFKNYPNFLVDMEDIAHIRNTFGAHAGDIHNDAPVLVDEVVMKVYQIVSTIIQAWKLNRNHQ